MPQSPDLAVEVKNLSVRFGDFYAVKDVSFSVRRGEIFGFLGANGAGTTTTIRVLCGLLVPSEGHVGLMGEDFSDGGFRIKSRVGYMSQKFTLYEDLTVGENLQFAASLRKLDLKRFSKRRDELLEFISFNRDLSTLVRDLPGGIKQQVSLATSLIHEPDIVFLDEPTAGVTPAYRARFWDLIRRLSSEGKTIFVTTHYMDEAESCHRVALMRSGQLIALDTPENLKHQQFPRALYELSPRGPLSMEKISALRHSENFSLFEPYGLRFHIELSQQGQANDALSKLSNEFEVQKKDPSLEDVFIRIVEGKTR
jgi:ABC-2 type transport system ATP-binding protein